MSNDLLQLTYAVICFLACFVLEKFELLQNSPDVLDPLVRAELLVSLTRVCMDEFSDS